MSTHAQIQLHFPCPGDWGRFLLTALWRDAAGYACRSSYAPAELPAAHLPALQSVVARLVALDEPWQATHVAVEPCFPEEEASADAGASLPVAEPVALALIIEARRADGARRSFSPQDYPEFRLEDAAALVAFRQLTGGS